MKTSPLPPIQNCGRLRATVLLWLGAVACACAQYGGQFVSATPQSPVTLGQSLNITVTVRNDTTDVWEPGFDIESSWETWVIEQSWCASCPMLAFYTTRVVNPGQTDTMVITLPAALLPTAAGSYSVDLATAWNWYDLIYSVMNGSPKTVNFTLVAPVTNRPPVITPIGNKAVVQTNLLTFTVQATDPDAPPQQLTFSLEAGAPAGAEINASTGLFTWTPPLGPTPRTNQIGVIVTDDGSPPLSDTNRFQVVVLGLPRFTGISQPVNGTVTLVWESFPGKSYQVRYRDNLASGSWTNLGSPLGATGAVTSITNNIGTARQRAYRLLLLD